MPIFDIDPGTLPETDGTLYFYRQGDSPSRGVQMTSQGNLTIAGALSVGGGISLTPPLDLSGAASGTDLITTAVTGDTQKRLIVNAGGGLDWGSGAVPVDTNLYRGGVGVLQTDSALTVGGNATLQGLTVQQPASMNTVNAAATTVTQLTVSGNATVTGTLTVTGVGQFREVAKAALLNRASTITPTDDPDLTLSVVANATYEVRCLAAWTQGGGGFRMAWNIPAAATMTWTDGGGSGMTLATTNATFTASTGTEAVGRLVTGATAGACTLQWAQSTSNAANTALQAGSFLSLRRVA